MDKPDDEDDEYRIAIEKNIAERASLAAFLDAALSEISQPDAWLEVARDPKRHPEAFRLAVELLIASNPINFHVTDGSATPLYTGERAASPIVAGFLRLGAKDDQGAVPVPFARLTRKEDKQLERQERNKEIATAVEKLISQGKTREQAIWAIEETGQFGLKESALVKAYDEFKENARNVLEREYIASLKGPSKLRYLLRTRRSSREN